MKSSCDKRPRKKGSDMVRAVVGRMPLWAGENEDIVAETAMLEEVAGAEYRQTEGQFGGAEGLRASAETDGAEPMGLKNKQDFKG